VRAGTLLADAGMRASQRGDVAATIELLERAIELLPEEDSRERRLLFTLGAALYDAADLQRSDAVLARAIAEADAAGDEGASALAAAGLVTVRNSTRSTEVADAVRELKQLASVLERTGDVAGARLAAAWVAFNQFALGEAGEAAARAMALVRLGPSDELWYREAMATTGAALIWGPTPVHEAIETIRALGERGGGLPVDTIRANQGFAVLHALAGNFGEAREALAIARAGFEELGNRLSLTWLLQLESRITRLAGDLSSARQLALDAFEAMTASGDRSFASTMAVDVADVLLDLDDLDEAWHYATIARDTSGSDDVMSQAGGRAVQARVLSRRGEHPAAEGLAREAEAMFAATDFLAPHGDAAVHMAHVFHGAGKADEAIAAAEKAAELYERKGATFLVDRTRRLLASWSA
jgi:tetratricopeptide (TPR) repeat protein